MPAPTPAPGHFQDDGDGRLPIAADVSKLIPDLDIGRMRKLHFVGRVNHPLPGQRAEAALLFFRQAAASIGQVDGRGILAAVWLAACGWPVDIGRVSEKLHQTSVNFSRLSNRDFSISQLSGAENEYSPLMDSFLSGE